MESFNNKRSSADKSYKRKNVRKNVYGLSSFFVVQRASAER